MTCDPTRPDLTRPKSLTRDPKTGSNTGLFQLSTSRGQNLLLMRDLLAAANNLLVGRFISLVLQCNAPPFLVRYKFHFTLRFKPTTYNSC